MRSSKQPMTPASVLSVEVTRDLDSPPQRHERHESVFSYVSWNRGWVMSLRIAVIGVGHLGRHHARILSTLPGVDLVAVVDTNRARAEEVAAANGTRPLFDARELADTVDAVTLAVPTERHRDLALPILS